MNRILLLALMLLVADVAVHAQTRIDTAAIVKQLEAIRARDQKTRTVRDSVDYVDFIDSTNCVQVEALIAKYGWPGKSFVGERGNSTVFLVIQHADIAVQEKYLPMLTQSVADGQSNLYDLALLQDRVLMRHDKPQIYGSQVVRNNATGEWELWKIADEEHVNERRKAAGLEPIKEYAAFFGIKYTGPAK